MQKVFRLRLLALPPWAAASVQVQFHSEELVPFPWEAANTLRALGMLEGWGEMLAQPVWSFSCSRTLLRSLRYVQN